MVKPKILSQKYILPIYVCLRQEGLSICKDAFNEWNRFKDLNYYHHNIFNYFQELLDKVEENSSGEEQWDATFRLVIH